MADLVFSMYYDNLTSCALHSRGVSAIDPTIPIFTRSSFIQEFAGQILYGFRLFMHTMEDKKDEERYINNILSTVSNVLEFVLSTR